MACTATFDDWLALLELRPKFLEIFEGQRQIGGAVADLAAARARRPGDRDYIDVLDEATGVLLVLRMTVAEQAEWLDKLRDEVWLINAIQEDVLVRHPPADPVDRLLNRAELHQVRWVLEEIDEAVDAIGNAPPPDDEPNDGWGDDWEAD
jgi:hypothetical protein